MAKGNMLLGYSRGSVGDVTFYRSGGSQRSRARNRNPNNPRTETQQAQRSKFANAVKFYKQVTTNFFRFAYEDKRTNESDYNAFMRHNVKNSGYIGAEAAKIANFPALGAWEITNGSLPELQGTTPEVSSNAFLFNLSTDTTSDDWDEAGTIGNISTLMITKGNGMWREGDIVTILLYVAKPSAGLPTIDTTKNYVADSNYIQFVLNTQDTTPRNTLKKKVNGIEFSIQFEDSEITVGGGTGYGTAFVQCAAVHSRNTPNGLLVSTAEMITNANDKIVTNAMAESGTYYNAVIADWNASAQAILQGAGS